MLKTSTVLVGLREYELCEMKEAAKKRGTLQNTTSYRYRWARAEMLGEVIMAVFPNNCSFWLEQSEKRCGGLHDRTR